MCSPGVCTRLEMLLVDSEYCYPNYAQLRNGEGSAPAFIGSMEAVKAMAGVQRFPSLFIGLLYPRCTLPPRWQQPTARRRSPKLVAVSGAQSAAMGAPPCVGHVTVSHQLPQSVPASGLEEPQGQVRWLNRVRRNLESLR